MAKLDKSQYTKEEWQIIRERRRIEKEVSRSQKQAHKFKKTNGAESNMCFVLGNGTSRSSVYSKELVPYGKTYGCNALYRTFSPDYLVAVDVKMVLEINKSGYQYNNEVWTNPNKAYTHMKNLNLFQPSKGWSSGPTALWLAAQHGYEKIYILGFDFAGLGEDKKFNNVYADTPNYKKSYDGATFFGNWLRQTKTIMTTYKNTKFIRVKAADNYTPPELNKFDNYSEIDVKHFKIQFDLS